MKTRSKQEKKYSASNTRSSLEARNTSSRTGKPVSSSTSAAVAARHRPTTKSLSLPDDSKWLSEPLCLIRKQIEVFAATQQDIAERRTGPKPPPGTVGIRCCHCTNLPLPYQARGAMAFPKSISLIHQAVRNFHRYHVFTCSEIPDQVKEELREFKPKGNQSIKGAANYWIQSSEEQLGLIDVEESEDEPRRIRFRDGWNPPSAADKGNANTDGNAAAPAAGMKRRRGSRSFDEDEVLSPTRAAAFDQIDIDADIHDDHAPVSSITALKLLACA